MKIYQIEGVINVSGNEMARNKKEAIKKFKETMPSLINSLSNKEVSDSVKLTFIGKGTAI
jgi:ferritin-like metal-binding protein YciE